MRQVPQEEWASVWCAPPTPEPVGVWRKEMNLEKTAVLENSSKSTIGQLLTVGSGEPVEEAVSNLPASYTSIQTGAH